MSNPTLFPIFWMDSPKVLDAYVTNIPGAGSDPIQVVAESGFRAAYAIQYIDTTGDYIGVYTGLVGNEVLVAIIGGGLVNITSGVIPAHSRVSLRSMTSSAITSGKLTLNFLGQGWAGGNS